MAEIEPRHLLDYPAYVITAEEKRRWDLVVEVAAQQLEVQPTSGQAWQAAHVLYASDIPTG